jgi:hypothetical protein
MVDKMKDVPEAELLDIAQHMLELAHNAAELKYHGATADAWNKELAALREEPNPTTEQKERIRYLKYELHDHEGPNGLPLYEQRKTEAQNWLHERGIHGMRSRVIVDYLKRHLIIRR